MASTAQGSETDKHLLSRLTSVADFLSKGVAAFALAIYACGFLIFSLHTAEYGFVGTNPLRPRVAAAGAWFLLFTAIPLYMVSRVGRLRERSWGELAQLSYTYLLACWGVSLVSLRFFVFSESSKLTLYPHWWLVLGAGALLVALEMLKHSKKIPNHVLTAASLLFVAAYLQYPLRELSSHRFGLDSVTFWLFWAGTVAVVEMKVRTQQGDWEKTVFLILGAVFLFARYYYPHIRSEWGGGTPVLATIYFVKDSSVSPCKSATVTLLDESDEGFFVLGQKESKALYIPRSAVSLIYFSDNPTSALLPNK